MDHARQVSIERASVDRESGEFQGVLFTGGEASDGHILNVDGGDLPDKMPLFVNHFADPVDQIGSLFPRKEGGEVLVRGRILTEGTGASAEIRRDLLLKMSSGDLSALSGRWDANEKDVTRRVNLPKDHPAFVTDKDTGEKRFGMFFAKWRAVEGSLVGLGADPAATVRFAREASSDVVRDFWRGQVDPAAQLATFDAQVRELLESTTLSPLDLVEALEQQYSLGRDAEELPNGEERLSVLLDRLECLLAGVRDERQSPQPKAKDEGAPEDLPTSRDTAPVVIDELASRIESTINATHARFADKLDSLIGRRTGKPRRQR